MSAVILSSRNNQDRAFPSVIKNYSEKYLDTNDVLKYKVVESASSSSLRMDGGKKIEPIGSGMRPVDNHNVTIIQKTNAITSIENPSMDYNDLFPTIKTGVSRFEKMNVNYSGPDGTRNHFFELFPEYMLTSDIEKKYPPIKVSPSKKENDFLIRNYNEKYVDINDVSKYQIVSAYERTSKVDSKMPLIGAESTQQEFFSNIIQTCTQKGEKIDMSVFAPNYDRVKFHFLTKEQVLKLMMENQEIIIKGDYGPKGETGPIGLRGEKGDQGLRGFCGPTGPTGMDGQRGDRGPRGYPGGPTGPMGPIGFRGERGPPGVSIRGPRGDRGATGPAGQNYIFVSNADKMNEMEISLLKVDTLILQGNNILKVIYDLQTKIQELETRLEKFENKF